MTENTSFIPCYDFSPSVNAAYLKEIIPLMVRHNVGANPINYAIWYDYVAGNNAKLTELVNSMISEQKAFDSETSIELYKKHVCNASLESFEKINDQIQKVIAQATSSINDTCHKAEETNDSFQKKTLVLENISEATDIKTVLQEIIQETKSLAETSHLMQTKLNDANKEMQQLRLELAQVRQAAVTDGLTGLLNRRAFDQTLAEIIDGSESHMTCLSMLDIDHFKRVNDTYGHTVGDNVIKYVAALMKKHAEDHHHVARYGGEELAIIMPNTTKEKAIEISEIIRSSMESSRLKRKDNSQPLNTITLSIGIAQLQAGDDAESFIVRADTALYKAKETGRNKVVHDHSN
ncbi:MAG: GGDEF domain-containing protein [Methylococcaceae bacterium]|nr:GGDEF domain-containing protein [Methylococcaceae bacterium]MDZ4157574.1 GGDEF domain-containing protein [Methylococcales bacterium]MDP2395067.1 GGDEF domain-containing protein [Methylococcaceae bacterium]MDP3019318.1 GGDEF domain-containing protein [Methylococcaceae bacterium]MDP3389102.1 GGDEF domain-containing protein [Methylococcaceae bacterium]